MHAQPTFLRIWQEAHGCHVDGLMINVENTIISSNGRIKVLGVKIDDKLNFTEHISDVCAKTGRQLNILQRLKRFLTIKVKWPFINHL